MKRLNSVLKYFVPVGLVVLVLFGTVGCSTLNKTRLLDAGTKAAQAATLTNAQIEQLSKEYMVWSDANNPICNDSDPNQKKYSDRLKKILGNANTTVSGRKLNIKVYCISDRNAFACADGSIRIFAGLMDVMSDDEIFGIIGHEIGHIANKDTKEAFRKALLTSALLDVVGSTGKTAATLTDSQLGRLAEAFSSAQFSQQQEFAADDYGYNFLKKNGKNPKAMASALRKLQQLFDDPKTDKSKIKQLFSTHPDSGKRAARLEKR